MEEKKGKKSSPGKYMGIVATLLVFTLLILAFFMPWWSYTVTDTSDDTVLTGDFSLNEVEFSLESEDSISTTTLTYAEDEEISTTFQYTSWMVYISIILAFISFILSILVLSKRTKRNTRMATVVIFLTIVMLLVTAMYFMFSLPDALSTDTAGEIASFYGTDTVGSVEYAFAPTYGWFFLLASFVVMLLAIPPNCKSMGNNLGCLIS